MTHTDYICHSNGTARSPHLGVKFLCTTCGPCAKMCQQRQTRIRATIGNDVTVWPRTAHNTYTIVVVVISLWPHTHAHTCSSLVHTRRTGNVFVKHKKRRTVQALAALLGLAVAELLGADRCGRHTGDNRHNLEPLHVDELPEKRLGENTVNNIG